MDLSDLGDDDLLPTEQACIFLSCARKTLNQSRQSCSGYKLHGAPAPPYTKQAGRIFYFGGDLKVWWAEYGHLARKRPEPVKAKKKAAANQPLFVLNGKDATKERSSYDSLVELITEYYDPELHNSALGFREDGTRSMWRLKEDHDREDSVYDIVFNIGRER